MFKDRLPRLVRTDRRDATESIQVGGLEIREDRGLPKQREVDHRLATEAQQYFAQETYEYPLVEGIAIDERLTPLEELNPPDIDLSNLADLQGTLDLLRETGVLP